VPHGECSSFGWQAAACAACRSPSEQRSARPRGPWPVGVQDARAGRKAGKRAQRDASRQRTHSQLVTTLHGRRLGRRSRPCAWRCVLRGECVKRPGICKREAAWTLVHPCCTPGARSDVAHNTQARTHARTHIYTHAHVDGVGDVRHKGDALRHGAGDDGGSSGCKDPLEDVTAGMEGGAGWGRCG